VTTTAARLGDVGLTWHPSGQVTLRGPLLDLLHDCDRAFLALAAQWGAVEEAHPAFLSAATLDRVDYLGSFPQLANFPVALADTEANLDRFRAGPVLDADGAVRLTGLAPVRDLLTPAACYHLYPQHQDERLDAPLHLTTRNTCFRRETDYQPLRRQRVFEMREIVCLGVRDDVVSFLERGRELVDDLFRELDVTIDWQVATDPFFRPAESHQHLFQRLHTTKREAVYGGDLAVASVNMHEDHFGAAFGITADEAPASSGCVAFGLDRWLFALTDRHGTDPSRWPSCLAAVERLA
jgi:hypothetical protein